jgi:hypothetical protein
MEQITSLPKAGDSSSKLVLKEVGVALSFLII